MHRFHVCRLQYGYNSANEMWWGWDEDVWWDDDDKGGELSIANIAVLGLTGCKVLW